MWIEFNNTVVDVNSIDSFSIDENVHGERFLTITIKGSCLRIYKNIETIYEALKASLFNYTDCDLVNID